MSLLSTSPDGKLQINDFTDGFYSAGTGYVDVNLHIPPEGVNDPGFNWDANADETFLTGNTFALTFSSGPLWYYLARVYIPNWAKVLTIHTDLTEDFSINLLVGQIPVARLKNAGVWRTVIPYVKDGGVWKEAKPYIHTADGWSETEL